MLNVGLEQQQQIRGADGSILWSGAQVLATTYIAKSSEASATLGMGEPAVWDPQTAAIGFIPRQETTTTTPASDLPGTLVLGCKRSQASAAADVNFLGVAQEPIGPSKLGLIAGPGSLTTVICETAATITIGFPVQGSATAGKVQPAAARTAAIPAYGTVLGTCFKINTAGATGTGSTGWVGILVQPY